MAAKWTVRILGACVMLALVHALMLLANVPRPEAWFLGSLIYAGLIAVLYSRKPLIEKIAIYAMFAVITWVGMLTVCPCTGAHFLLAPAAGLLTLWLVHLIARLAGWEHSPTAAELAIQNQQSQRGYGTGEFYTALNNSSAEEPQGWP